ncbi:hypothetical protein ACOSQ3_012534 [Xanthoceras sorbifolium]
MEMVLHPTSLSFRGFQSLRRDRCPSFSDPLLLHSYLYLQLQLLKATGLVGSSYCSSYGLGGGGGMLEFGFDLGVDEAKVVFELARGG